MPLLPRAESEPLVPRYARWMLKGPSLKSLCLHILVMKWKFRYNLPWHKLPSICLVRIKRAPREQWMLYILTSVFAAKNLKKARNLQQISAKNSFFLVCTRTLVDCFIPKKRRKWLFWPAFGVRSIQTLVEIYNKWKRKVLLWRQRNMFGNRIKIMWETRYILT